MPLLDGDDKVVGLVLREDKATGSYIRSYLVLDFSTHKLKMYPEFAEFEVDLSTCQTQLEINCQYITKVLAALARPKVLNCIEIGTTTGSHFFSVDGSEERDEWIESIRKSSMKQSVAPVLQPKRTEIGYQTKVVGGVVQKIPIKASENGGAGKLTVGAQSGAAGQSKIGNASRRSRGFPRVLKAGYGIKLGAVMKNWKRRFFVLTEISFGYYKSIEEVDPIKMIPVGGIASVSRGSKDISGKEFLFEVVTPNRTFYVQIDTQQEMEEWVKVFNDLLRNIKPSLQNPNSYDQQVGVLEDSDEDDELCPVTAV